MYPTSCHWQGNCYRQWGTGKIGGRFSQKLKKYILLLCFFNGILQFITNVMGGHYKDYSTEDFVDSGPTPAPKKGLKLSYLGKTWKLGPSYCTYCRILRNITVCNISPSYYPCPMPATVQKKKKSAVPLPPGHWTPPGTGPGGGVPSYCKYFGILLKMLNYGKITEIVILQNIMEYYGP